MSLVAAAALAATQPAQAQFTQQGAKLVGTGAAGAAQQGTTVALSADGNTAIVGGYNDNSGAGAAWVLTRSGGVWTQQGAKLVGTGAIGNARQGWSVALSADGNTAIIGGWADNSGMGAAWVFTRSGGVWTQQGAKLVGTGAAIGGPVRQGYSVALSADGNTAIIGGSIDNSGAGAAWVFTRSSGVWSQQGAKLVGTGAVGAAQQGTAVALSADGSTAMVGGPQDGGAGAAAGAVWVFTRSGGSWSQQGAPFFGNATAGAQLGSSVALSGDGNTAIVGAPFEFSSAGRTYVFTRSGGVWSQQGGRLLGSGGTSTGNQGTSVTVSADGKTLAFGGPADSGGPGAAWVFTSNGPGWTQQGSKLVGTGVTGAGASQGFGVAISADAGTLAVGGYGDNSTAGATWVFTQPILFVTPTSNITAVGGVGGPFSPPSFDFVLRTPATLLLYAISGGPDWLSWRANSAAVSNQGTTVTLTVDSNAYFLPVGTYGPTPITFVSFDPNTQTSTAVATIQATLTVGNPGPLSVVSAVLPASRSVQVNNTATAFSTIINTGATTATKCGLGFNSNANADFHFQTTDPATNQLNGTLNTAVDIPANGAQTYVFSVTPYQAFDPRDINIAAGCSNSAPAPTIVGLNTLLLSASDTPVPDIVALAATAGNNGIVDVAGANGAGAFAVATVNVGIGGDITASADTGSTSLPVSITLCQTNPASGQCTSAVGPTVTTNIAANATPTFAIFVQALGAVPFDPAHNRIFVRFRGGSGGGVVRGATSVAVRTQ